jgi:hypothetical protein
VPRPLPDKPKPVFRPETAKPRTRSALVVPPDFGGLLRMHTLQVCCTLQPAIGFATFQKPAAVWLQSRRPGSELHTRSIPDGDTPFEAFPSSAGHKQSPRLPAFTRMRFPRAVGPRYLPPYAAVLPRLCARWVPVSSTSGHCSAEESVTSQRCCHRWSPVAPLGFISDSRFGDAYHRASEEVQGRGARGLRSLSLR